VKIKPHGVGEKVEKTGEIAAKNNEQWRGDRQKSDLIYDTKQLCEAKSG
jgi:hypothetical protein